jgi:hypothetical protein
MSSIIENKIKVKDQIEPFTLASENLPEDHWPRCESLEQLEREIGRYCRGEIQGCSLLIAGHRGSGKTTLTHIAIQNAERRWKAGKALRFLPLFVPLHGPDFVVDGSADRQINGALSEIVNGLLRAVSERIARCSIGHTAQEPWNLEIATQLRVELDHSPDLATLREYWERLGALETGLLHGYGGTQRDGGQGFRELLAVHTCVDACRVLAEPVGKREPATPPFTMTTDSGEFWQSNWKHIAPAVRSLGPFVSIAAGILVAWTLRDIMQPYRLVPLGLGLFTTVACSWFLRHYGADTKERTLFSEPTRAQLDRVLPLLVSRIIDAGMAPIFVVDELDKVSRLPDKLEVLLTHLKHFVSDRAFFCFLADRTYYESLALKIEGSPYPVQSTFFSTRILMQYAPEDLRTYLKILLDTGGEQQPDCQSAQVSPSPEVKVTEPKGPGPKAPAPKTSEPKSPEQDRELIIYVLLQLSRLHIGELHRLLSEHTDRDGYVRLPDEGPQTRVAYFYMVLIQCAVEVVLAGRDVNRRLRQNPQLRQVTHDAVYYLSRNWRLAAQGGWLDCREDAFANYLRDRTGGDTISISEEIRRTLFEAMKDVVSWTSRPAALADHLWVAPGSKPREDLRESLRRVYPLVTINGDRAVWQFDESGKPLTDEARATNREKPAHAEISLTDRVKRIVDLTELMNQLGGAQFNLDTLMELKVLETAPDWDTTTRSIEKVAAQGTDDLDTKMHKYDDALLGAAPALRCLLLHCMKEFFSNRRATVEKLNDSARAFLRLHEKDLTAPQWRFDEKQIANIGILEANLRKEMETPDYEMTPDLIEELAQALVVRPNKGMDRWLATFRKLAGIA